MFEQATVPFLLYFRLGGFSNAVDLLPFKLMLVLPGGSSALGCIYNNAVTCVKSVLTFS